MPRTLDVATLDGAAAHYAALFLQDRPPHDRNWVMGQFFNFTFKDEFDHLTSAVAALLGGDVLGRFEHEVKALAGTHPRDQAVFEAVLAAKLAITPDGEHIAGLIGSTIIGGRRVGEQMVHVIPLAGLEHMDRCRALGVDPGVIVRHPTTRPLDWPIYAGEGEERIADSGVADPLPKDTEPLPLGALNTRIAVAAAIAMCTSMVIRMDEGSLGGVAQGRTGAQPAFPDTLVTGTNLFTVTCSDPAFGAPVDVSPGARATANAITPDASADATGTLGYCRGSSSNVADTPLTAHIDGEAGLATADFIFNTLNIVAGAEVSLLSWTVTMPQNS